LSDFLRTRLVFLPLMLHMYFQFVAWVRRAYLDGTIA